MICIAALIIFGILGIFSASHRVIAKEALECVFRRLTLRKCETGLDKRLKNQISGKLAKKNPKLGRFLFKYFEVFSWLFLMILVLSLVYIGIGFSNYVQYGNCNGPENNDGFCVFDPTGSHAQYSGISIDYPSEKTLPQADGDPSIGPEDAKVTVIEFGCFSCPFTKKAEPAIQQLVDEYDGQSVRFVFKEFPLPKHPGSMEASIAVQCAYDNGKYFEARSFLFENQEKIITGEVYKDLANHIGMDENEFLDCMNNQEAKDKVLEDVQEGVNAHIFGTPTVFINGETIVGPKEYSFYKKVIDKALAK